MYTENEVLDFIEEEDVKFIRLAFFDISGKQKNISIMPSELPRAFKEGISFDASAILGFESPDKSDLFLQPDPSTLAILPWRPTSGKVVRMFCNIKNPDGSPYKKDYRNLLKNAIKKAKDEFGIEIYIGAEVEFYLFKLNEKGEPTKEPFDQAGYMDIAPDDKGENIRREICFTLEQMGIIPEASHHEEGPGQNEIDFHYSDALTAADNTATFKWIVRTKAASNGLFADFSPKPLADKPGSGMHINISYKSLRTEDKVDYLPYMLGGILNHIEEMTYYLNPSEESYDRLGEFKAPKYICWGKENRSALVRVPSSKHDIRFEIRSSDPSCNPYLAFSLVIFAALDGIKNKIIPPNPVSDNLFNEDFSNGLKLLPDTIDSARTFAANSSFIKNILSQGY